MGAIVYSLVGKCQDHKVSGWPSHWVTSLTGCVRGGEGRQSNRTQCTNKFQDYWCSRSSCVCMLTGCSIMAVTMHVIMTEGVLTNIHVCTCLHLLFTFQGDHRRPITLTSSTPALPLLPLTFPFLLPLLQEPV